MSSDVPVFDEMGFEIKHADWYVWRSLDPLERWIAFKYPTWFNQGELSGWFTDFTVIDTAYPEQLPLFMVE